MRDQLIEALKMLGRGRIDAAETIVDLVMPKGVDPRTLHEVDLSLPTDKLIEVMEAQAAAKKKFK